MKTLAFDTSNKTLSLAILDDETLLADMTLNIQKNHSVSLMPAIDFLMTCTDLKPQDLERIVVAKVLDLTQVYEWQLLLQKR